MRTVWDVLHERGFIHDVTDARLKDVVDKPLTVYAGFDPSSDSLHIGNLVAIMGLAHFQSFGHKVVALVGGATGMIGDPTGRSSERTYLDEESLLRNVEGIEADLKNVLGQNEQKSFCLLNNYDWFKDINCLRFLRDIGKYFRIGPMLSKESVRLRMESQEGMSFTEFSYQVLQGYDFLHLHKTRGVTLELGGSDQWGNITAGTELVRKVLGKTVYGMTFPLLTRSDGKKFGKSEEGAVWLSKGKLSPYKFYQYFMSIPDEDVGKLLRLLTFMELSAINALEKKMQEGRAAPHEGQKILAEEITRLIHGPEELMAAVQASEAAAFGSTDELNADALSAVASQMPHCDIDLHDLLGAPLIDIMLKAGLSASKGAARRSIQGGGVYINNRKVQNDSYRMEPKDLIDGKFLLLSLGRKNKVLIRIHC